MPSQLTARATAYIRIGFDTKECVIPYPGSHSDCRGVTPLCQQPGLLDAVNAVQSGCRRLCPSLLAPPPPKSGARLCSFVFSTSCWCQPLPGLIDSLYSRVAASSPQVARAQGVGVEKSLRSMKEERCPLLKFLPHSRFVHIKMSALHERGRQRRTYTPVRRMRLCLL